MMLQLRNSFRRNALNKVSRLTKKRKYSSSSTYTSYEEIKIPVPWGHIAGKWWGPQDKRPILGLHGWQDNCGTFDRLAPYLSPHIGFLTIDFPSHGFSTQLPTGMFLHSMDYVIAVRRIVQYFNWDKVSLLGHSWGGITSYLYTVFFPDNVDFLICLDAIKPFVFKTKELKSMDDRIDTFIKYDYLNNNENEPPCYYFHELETKLHEASDRSISLENCKYILKRHTKVSEKEPDKFYFNVDARLKVLFLQNWPQDITTESTNRLLCPTFMSYSSERFSIYKDYTKAEDIIEILKENNKNFEIHNVEGTHHAHLNNPERLEGLLKKFIKKYDTENRFG